MLVEGHITDRMQAMQPRPKVKRRKRYIICLPPGLYTFWGIPFVHNRMYLLDETGDTTEDITKAMTFTTIAAAEARWDTFNPTWRDFAEIIPRKKK